MSKEIAAFVCSHVFEKRSPVLLVSHAEGDWQLLCGGAHEESEIPRVVGLSHLVGEDPSLRVVLDLPEQWEAERASPASSWERRPIA
ncbi:MAG: hypothetical protein ACJ8AT_10830 [Hyalangium sp.]|uniref:hypothetical protein n=1 Tax=Hyalangium sp. TaxID=2028555 RepID=UPI00389A962D